MRFLLDVNALIALGFANHQFHVRVSNWTGSLRSVPSAEFLTTPITELGFVRVLSQVYGIAIIQAKNSLRELKVTTPVPFGFLIDDQNISTLPAWVKKPKQTTDGHLVALAASNGATLATLDEEILERFKIP
jgi:predicted nucleic acid-binding protein